MRLTVLTSTLPLCLWAAKHMTSERGDGCSSLQRRCIRPLIRINDWHLGVPTVSRGRRRQALYSMLRNSASGPELGLPGPIFAGLLPAERAMDRCRDLDTTARHSSFMVCNPAGAGLTVKPGWHTITSTFQSWLFGFSAGFLVEVASIRRAPG